MLTKLERYVSNGVIKEIFAPKYIKPMKIKGQWVYNKRPLFPGYVVVDTDQIDRLDYELKSTSFLARLLGNGKEPIPLTPAEVSWLLDSTEVGNRVIGVSEGVMKGDEIIVESGPLVGHSAWIESVNRHKRMAYLVIDMFGQRINARAGLHIKDMLPA